MNSVYIEQRTHGYSSLSWDITRHLYARIYNSAGTAIVVAHKPSAFVASVRKQWLRLERQVRYERSSTLRPNRIRELTQALSRVEHIHMTAKPADEAPACDVFFVASLPQQIPPDCHTIYVINEINAALLAYLSTKMPPHSLIVRYDLPAQPD